MIDVKKNWPFGFNKSNLPYFIIGVLVILGVMLLIDGPVTRAVAALPEFVRAPFRIITRAGNSDWILIPTLLGTIIGFILLKLNMSSSIARMSRMLFSFSLFIFASVGITGIVANLIKRLVGRARPMNFEEFGIFTFDPVINGWSFQSFPSGDATTVFALAAALMFLLPRLTPLLLFGAALVGLSRIMVGVHFPSDVFGGILLGTFGAYAIRNFCLKRGWLIEAAEGNGFRIKR